MKRSLIFYLLVLFCQQAIAQANATKDSLFKSLARSEEDTNKVLMLIQTGQYLENSSLEEAKSFYFQAKVLSEKLGYKMGIIKYFSNYAAALNWQGLYDSSLLLSQQSLLLAEELGNQEKIALSQHNIAACYGYLQNNEKALEWELKSLPYFENSKDNRSTGVIYDAIGTIYRKIGNFDKSVEFHKKALNFATNTDDDYGKAVALANLGAVLINLKKYPEALTTLNKTIELSRGLNAVMIQQTAFTNIANVYLKQGNYDSTKFYAEAALESSKKIGDSSGISLCLFQVAVSHFFERNFARSESLAIEGFGIAKLNHYTELLHLHANILSELALIKGDLDQYGYWDRLSDSYSEQYINETIQGNIQVLDKRYETEKREKQLTIQKATLAKQNILNYFFAGSTIALILIYLLYYRNHKQNRKLQEQKISELEKEKLLLAAQSILKGQEEERSRLAKDLHDGLGGMLSGVKLQLGSMKGNLIMSEELSRSFNGALNKLDETINEMRRVAHNMMPEALLRLGLPQALQDYCHSLAESQQFTINCEFHSLEERMPSTTEIVVYRIVQELVNNAVKHSGATIILAQVIRQANNLSVTVEDNGKGFSNIDEALTKGSGLLSIKSRVDYLKGQMDIQSTPGKGSSIHIDCIIEQDAKD